MTRLFAIVLLLLSTVAYGQTTPISSLTATWNNGATTFEAIKMDITDTASAAGSSALWLGFSATEVFRVDKDGTIYASSVAMPTISSIDTLTNKTIVAANNTLTLFAGGANNQLLTDDGSGGLVSESGLVFDGTNLGIGSGPSPSGLLHVAGSANAFTIDAVGLMELVGTSPQWGFADTNQFTDPDDRILLTGDVDNFLFRWQDASNGNARTTIMSMQSANGAADVRVGIRTGSPEEPLTVRGTLAVRFNDSGTDRGVKLTGSAGNNTGIIDSTNSTTGLEFRIGNVEQMRLVTAGFGVRVKSPLEVLQVDDAIAISSDAEGSVGRLTRRSIRELHTLTLGATSDTTAISIPAGARFLGTSMNVNTAVTNDGDNTWKADWITGSTQVIAAAGTAAAQNTKVNSMHPIYELAAATAEIRFTSQSGNFTAGVIEIVAYFESLTSLADL